MSDHSPALIADLEWAVRRASRKHGEDVIDWIERVLVMAGVRKPGEQPVVKPWPELGPQERDEIEAARNEPEVLA